MDPNGIARRAGNYALVNHNHQSCSTPSITASSLHSASRRPRPKPIYADHTTHIKYLDDDDDDDDNHDDEDEDIDGYHKRIEEESRRQPRPTSRELHDDLRRSPIFKHCQSEPCDVLVAGGTNNLPIPNPPPKELTRREPEPDYSDREDVASLEEVYLCNCCGITRELEPAMKYMPLFKTLFGLFNFLALLFAVGMLGMGLWFRIDPKVYEIHRYIETQNFTIAGWILLAGGLTVALVALVIGFSAPARQSTCMLMFYALVMVIMSIVFIGTLVLLSVYGLGSSLERFLTKEIYEQIRRRAMSAEPLDLLTGSEATQFLDFVQVKDFRDYQKLGMIIPTTCYTIAGNYINAPGCGSALREIMDIRAGLAAGLTAAGIFAQLLASLLAGLMICSLYNHRASYPRPASVTGSLSGSRPRSRSGSGTLGGGARSPSYCVR